MRPLFPRQPRAQAQPLEARTFLSATVSFDPDIGVLHVIGDDAHDRIEVSLIFGADGPGPAIGMLVTVRDHGQEIYRNHFLDGQLTDVRLSGEFGNDVLSVFNHDSRVDTFISGDAGNDTIDAFVELRAPPSRIHAGTGDDLVTLATGPNALDGYVVLGEGGSDTLSGSRMGDVLFGDNESVSPVSTPGDDVIRGNGGDDALYGGVGNDELFGGDGNDLLVGGEGSDQLDGGAGIDSGVVDRDDKFTSIEKVATT
jgi:Ca2+-binding RTX toxin-like protein